jgi:hypothetical protein
METITFISPSVQPRTETNGAEPYTPLPDAPVRGAVRQTVFDFGITPQEQIDVFGYNQTYDEYVMLINDDGRYADLWKLFTLRGDKQRADDYKSRIADESSRFWTGYTDLLSV